MYLANDCAWTDDSTFNSTPSARNTGLPSLGGYECERDADGALNIVTVTVWIGGDKHEHRAEATYRVETGDATPARVTFPNAGSVGPRVEHWLAAIAAAEEAVGRLEDVHAVQGAAALLEELRAREPADAWEVLD